MNAREVVALAIGISLGLIAANSREMSDELLFLVVGGIGGVAEWAFLQTRKEESLWLAK